MEARVSRRAQLDQVLRELDNCCLAYFDEDQRGAGASLSPQQRRAAKKVVQAFRNALHSRLKAQIVVNEDVSEDQKEMERLDEELLFCVDETKVKCEQLHDRIVAMRDSLPHQFAQKVALVLKENDDVNAQVKSALKSFKEQVDQSTRALNDDPAHEILSYANLSRLFQVVDRTKSKIIHIEDSAPPLIASLVEQRKYLEDRAAKPPSSLEKVLTESIDYSNTSLKSSPSPPPNAKDNVTLGSAKLSAMTEAGTAKKRKISAAERL